MEAWQKREWRRRRNQKAIILAQQGVLPMRHKALFAFPVLVLTALAFFPVASANGKDDVGPYRYLTTVTVPGNLVAGFDISWVDSASERYYLADRTSASVDVIDAEHDPCL